MNLFILTRYGGLGASSRMRFLQFLPWLEKENMVYNVSELISDSKLKRSYQNQGYSFLDLLQSYVIRIQKMTLVSQYDLIWIEKEALPWLPAWFERYLLRNKSYVLDYDDAIFHNYDQHRLKWVRYFLGRRIDHLMANATLVTVGNPYLAQRAKDAGAKWVEIIPTVVDLNRYPLKKLNVKKNQEPLRIVWIGSPSTMKFLKILEVPLAELSQHFNFKLRVIAGSGIHLSGVDVEFVAWSHETEVDSIQACDIGVMPLIDSDWERGKCGYKLIQYMACSLPVVASPVGVNCEIVSDNGYLAETTEEWVRALTELFENQELRHQMGEKGRNRVEVEYCIQQVAPKLAHLLCQAKEKY